MNYQPHEYQQYATDFIIKNPTAAVILELCLERFEISRVLVIAPLRVARDTWPAEIQKWDHLKDLTYSVAVGTANERRAALRQKTFIHIINRENVQWLIEDSGIPWQYDMVVIDELSSFKSHQSKRFKSLMKARPGVRRMVDLWSEFRVLDMGKRLGRFITHYREQFFEPDRRNGMQVFSYRPRAGAEREIYRRIGDITISMRSADYLKMPECVMNTVPVKLDSTEYEEMESKMVTELDGVEIDAVNAAALTGKLCQLANGAIYTPDGNTVFFHERKLDALEDLIEGANGKPVLVAYWYKHDLARIQERFKVRELKSSKDITDWNAGKIPVAVIHPASAGHGLNLQAGGSTLIWFGLTWSLELYQQTNARLWRQGQQAETVVIHHIITRGTVDEDVMQSLSEKDRSQAALMRAVRARVEARK